MPSPPPSHPQTTRKQDNQHRLCLMKIAKHLHDARGSRTTRAAAWSRRRRVTDGRGQKQHAQNVTLLRAGARHALHSICRVRRRTQRRGTCRQVLQKTRGLRDASVARHDAGLRVGGAKCYNNTARHALPDGKCFGFHNFITRPHVHTGPHLLLLMCANITSSIKRHFRVPPQPSALHPVTRPLPNVMSGIRRGLWLCCCV